MTLEEEMKLWEERKNDTVGKIIDFAYNETKDIVYRYTDMFGIEHNPIKAILAMYQLDGDIKYSIRKLKSVLCDYDICNFDDIECSNYPEIAREIVEIEKSLN